MHDVTCAFVRLALPPRNHNILLALEVGAEAGVDNHPLRDERATLLTFPAVGDALGLVEENMGESLSFECCYLRIVAVWLVKCQNCVRSLATRGARVVTQKQAWRRKQWTVWGRLGCCQKEVVQRVCIEKSKTHSNTVIMSVNVYFEINNAPLFTWKVPHPLQT